MTTRVQSRIQPPRRGRWLILGGVVLAGALGWFWKPLNGFAITGASYGAHVSCSCHYIEGRGLGECRKDFEPGMELVMLSANEPAKSVTATFPLLARQTATYRPGQGCQLQPWRR